jgi:hypothetical protein
MKKLIALLILLFAIPPYGQQCGESVQLAKMNLGVVSGGVAVVVGPPTLTDNFNDNSINTSVWDIVIGTGGSVAEANQVIETTSSSIPDGLVTDNAYDLTGLSSVQIECTYIYSGDIQITVAPTHVTSTDVYDEQDYIRIIWASGGTWYLQQRVAGTRSTIASGSIETALHTWKLEFPASGNEVVAYCDTTELAHIDTFPLASRSLYVYILATGTLNLDNFSMQYH